MYAPEGSTIIGAIVNLMLMAIQVIFIILKVTNLLDWSWFWTLIWWVVPVLTLLAFIFSILLILGFVYLIGKLFGYNF